MLYVHRICVKAFLSSLPMCCKQFHLPRSILTPHQWVAYQEQEGEVSSHNLKLGHALISDLVLLDFLAIEFTRESGYSFGRQKRSCFQYEISQLRNILKLKAQLKEIYLFKHRLTYLHFCPTMLPESQSQSTNFELPPESLTLWDNKSKVIQTFILFLFL